MTRNKKTKSGPKEGAGPAVAQAAAKTPAKSAEAAPARPRVGPFKFISQVRQEVAKVTWPTRNETTVTAVMVFIMVTLAALFFFLVDQILGTVVRWVLGF